MVVLVYYTRVQYAYCKHTYFSLERLIFDFTDGASPFYDALLKEHKAKLPDDKIKLLNHIFGKVEKDSF